MPQPTRKKTQKKTQKAASATRSTQSARSAPRQSTPQSKTRRRWLVPGIALSVVVLGIAGLAGFLEGYGRRDQARAADAIIVLGSRVAPQGVPEPTLRARTLHAVALYQKGLASKIICTGGIGTYPPSEAQAAATLAKKHHVPARDLLLEDQSTSTWENALYAAKICRRHGWKRVIVVSDGFHLWRAQYLFTQAGLEAYPSPARDTPTGLYPLRRAGWTLREAILVVRDVAWRR